MDNYVLYVIYYIAIYIDTYIIKCKARALVRQLKETKQFSAFPLKTFPLDSKKRYMCGILHSILFLVESTLRTNGFSNTRKCIACIFTLYIAILFEVNMVDQMTVNRCFGSH